MQKKRKNNKPVEGTKSSMQRANERRKESANERIQHMHKSFNLLAIILRQTDRGGGGREKTDMREKSGGSGMASFLLA